MVNARYRHWAAVFSACIAAMFVLLAVVGAVRSYSPVPYWDSWDGYLTFFLHARSGHREAWLAFHGEHRIVLTRLAFYADLAWARGCGVVPLVATYLVAAAGAFLFCRSIDEVAPMRPRDERIACGSLVVALMFFWSQQENFTWAFQTQFLLSTVVPLAALYLSAHSLGARHRKLYFAAAACLGFAALGTMANGVLALPAMLLHAVAVGMSRRRIGTLGVLTLLAITLSRIGFVAIPGQASPVYNLLHQPAGVLRFFLTYLGAPLASVFPEGRLRGIATLAGGSVVLGASALAVWRTWAVRRSEPLRMAMIALVGYLLATALATAAGRLGFGLDSAVSSRYTTTGITTWCALIVALFASRRDPPSREGHTYAFTSLTAILLLVLLPAQLDALNHRERARYARSLGALALEMQANDGTAIREIYPQPARALATGLAARDQGLSVFGLPPLDGAHALLGHQAEGATEGTCAGRITSIEAIGEGSDLLRVRGALNSPGPESSEAVLIVDERDTIVGFALSQPGGSRSRKLSGGSNTSFQGYMRRVAGSADASSRLRACLHGTPRTPNIPE